MLKKIGIVLLIIVILIGMYLAYERLKPIDQVFPKQAEVFGIKFYGTASVSDEKFKHAQNIMAEYLDNDEDGRPDNQAVVDEIVKRKAGMMMVGSQKESAKIMLLNRGIFKEVGELQEVYDSETHLNAVANKQFDVALEEILHLITHVGYANVYPEVWGEKTGTAVANAMDIARGGQFIEIPKKYPDDAWYTYYDETADYGTMVTEYVYWSLTSVLGAQDFEGRLEAIEGEWQLNTKEKVKTTDKGIYKLLTDPIYKLPTEIPDGNYEPKQL